MYLSFSGLHQKSRDIDVLGFSVFLHASPTDFNTAVWPQSNIQQGDDPSFCF